MSITCENLGSASYKPWSILWSKHSKEIFYCLNQHLQWDVYCFVCLPFVFPFFQQPEEICVPFSAFKKEKENSKSFHKMTAMNNEES